ncbi:MAG: ThuA domain-containing protein [Verrucomicrobia bacterium]|nr:ThuA domain-containing protein [Verrucomicrobiota bacterium]
MKTFLSILLGALALLIFRGHAVADETNSYKILVFSKTAGFRHSSIPNGIAAIQSLGSTNGFTVDATEDATEFTDANLQNYKAVVFLSTTGDVLNNTQQGAFERYIQAGGGYAGIHAASDTEYGWPWYGQLVGAYFAGHPNVQQATIKVADRTHPSTSFLSSRWIRTDEWYYFSSNPRGKVHVLATLDETTYSGGGMGADHPIIWCHEFDGGRAWYTGGGHTEASFAEPLFRQHLLGGIEYAAGIKKVDAGATIESNFQKVILDNNLNQPMELSVAADGRVFYMERGGKIKVYNPDAQSIHVAGQLSVFKEHEDGLLGLTLDPGFMTNNWLYLMYSPAGAIPKQHVSRFTMIGNIIDLNSEKVLLEIPTQRDECCHSAGSLTFGPDGSLFISTGDNTNPFGSAGYSPLDERPGRSIWDAQKSAANANDLRGKILRIRPEPDGTYSIPGGNLFSSGTPNTKPEIYVMGCRNPFRISVDAETGWLYWGDVGPDAYVSDANRGPAGYDEWNQTRSAGNYGWPYFIANNKAYREYDLATGVSGPFYNAAAPFNNSPNNTGPQNLPPARPAWIWYPYGFATDFPDLGTNSSRTAFAGPVYHYDPNLVSSRKLPPYYDKTVFIYDMWRSHMKEVKLDENGDVLKINAFLPNTFLPAIDIELGPDGALYLLEWHSGTTGRLTRIEYVLNDYAPVAVAEATPASGSVPLLVSFSSAGSHAVGTNETLSFAWSFLGNEVINSTAANPSFAYTEPGNYEAQLTVTDAKGNTSVTHVSITAGNNEPVITIHDPPNGSFFDWGQMIQYQISATDLEDGAVLPCHKLVLEPLLGHDQHAHSQGQISDCAGIFQSPSLDPFESGRFFLLLTGSYTDDGAPGVAPLTGKTTHYLNPRRQQAEYPAQTSGIEMQPSSDPNGGGLDAASIDSGDWLSFSPVCLTNITAVTCRIGHSTGGLIEMRTGSPSGTIIGIVSLPVVDGYTNVTSVITDPGGTHELFFRFVDIPGGANSLVVNWFEFQGVGVNQPIFLQSTSSPEGGFTDDPLAVMDAGLKRISVPLPETSRFYRIRAALQLRIESIEIVGTNLVLGYE